MFPRQKIIKKFISILDEEKTAEKMAINIEESIFDYTTQQFPLPDDNEDYSDEVILFYTERARSIYDNLNPDTYFDNKEGITKFKNINIDLIGSYNIKDLRYKNLWKRIKQNQEILDKNLMDLKPTTETDQFLCNKCKQRKTTFYTMQIRSADEPETSFITCLNCDYSWREG